MASRTRPGPMRRDWAMIMCFSCGKTGHGVGRCPVLNERFPLMLPGWSAEKVGDGYVMILPQVAAERRRVGNADCSGVGGQPPGSVMELDPRSPEVVRCISLSPRGVAAAWPVVPPIVHSETLRSGEVRVSTVSIDADWRRVNLPVYILPDYVDVNVLQWDSQAQLRSNFPSQRGNVVGVNCGASVVG